MRYIVLTFCLLLAFSVEFYGQTKISGRIVDEGNSPIENANVSAYNADSLLLTGCVTDRDGTFLIVTDSSDVRFIIVTCLGYEQLQVEMCKKHNLQLVMHTKSNELKEVVVTNNNPLYKMDNDKLVATVHNTALENLGNVEDILRFIPGIAESKDGLIVYGKGTPEYYINGRKLHDLSELQRLDGSEIRSIELIKNPGSEYSGSARAVINIKTIRKQGEGVSLIGKSYLQLAHRPSVQEMTSINYRKNKFDIFTTFQYTNLQQYQDAQDKYGIFNDTPIVLNSDYVLKNNIKTYNAKTGFDYYFNKTNSMGMSYTFLYRKMDVNIDKNDKVVTGSSVIDRQTDKQETDEPTLVHRVDAYYDGWITSKLRLSFNNEILFNSSKDNRVVNEWSQNSDDRTVTSNYKANNLVFASELRLAYNLWNGTLTTGVDYSYTKRNTTYNNLEGFLYNTDNKIYQNLIGIYASYNINIQKFRFNVGVRYEHNNFNYYENNILSNEQSREYNEIYPTISMTYPFGNLTTNLSYSIKSEYPSYTYLNEDIHYDSRYVYNTGNSSLRPVKIQDLQLMLQYKYATLTLDYIHQKNTIIEDYSFYDKQSSIIRKSYANYPYANIFQVYLTLQKKLKFWQPTLSAGLVVGNYKAYKGGRFMCMNNPHATITFNNIFVFPHNWNMYLLSEYNTRGDTELSSNMPYGRVSLIVTKSWKNIDFLILFNDIFKSVSYEATTYSNICTNYYKIYTDTQNIQATLRIRFNATNSKYKGRSVADKEANRM